MRAPGAEGHPYVAGADELVTLLRPHPARAGKDPHGAGVVVVPGSAHQRRVAVCGKGNGNPLTRGSHRAGADQLAALLRPRVAGAGEHPGGAGAIVVSGSAHERGVAVCGKGDGSLSRAPHPAGADKLAASLQPLSVGAGQDPHGPDAVSARGSSHERGVAVCGEGDRRARSLLDTAANQHGPFLHVPRLRPGRAASRPQCQVREPS